MKQTENNHNKIDQLLSVFCLGFWAQKLGETSPYFAGTFIAEFQNNDAIVFAGIGLVILTVLLK